ncbi:MAG: serine/threonine-protein kinase [Polyangiaceae bacterium]
MLSVREDGLVESVRPDEAEGSRRRRVDAHAATMRSILPGDPALEPAERLEISPAALVELMLGAAIWCDADLVVLQPADGGEHQLLVKRAAMTLAKLAVERDTGDAAVARLALLTGLDPLVASGSLEGHVNVARQVVRAAEDRAEVLVTVGASSEGLEAEVRTQSVSSTAASQASHALKRCTQCGAVQSAAHRRCALDGGMLVLAIDDPRPGGAIGAWRVLSKLGVGASGTVFAVEHALIGRAGAVKVLHVTVQEAPLAVRRFLVEARAACRLRHPNVVEVTDFGVLASGQPYLVMERLAGAQLAERLDAEGALQPKVALSIAREIARALEAAHAAGIVHNDLKPENVVLLEGSTDETPRLKVVDFGASSLAGVPDEEKGVVYGTPAYMAPERVQSDVVDPRSDLYAVGIMLHEMLGGVLPFPGPTPEAMLKAHIDTMAPPAQSPYGPLPPSVLRLVERVLRKRADTRHQTATELLADLERAITDVGRSDWRRWLP